MEIISFKIEHERRARIMQSLESLHRKHSPSRVL